MFIDMGEGWQVNLALVAKIHMVDRGGVGTVLKFYSDSNDHLGDFTPKTPEELQGILGVIRSFGKANTGL